jgi:signal transduction histidine kinase
MSLRTRLLYFFGLLAVLPLLAMGLLHYVQSLRTVERHIAAQVELIAERAAEELSRRHELHVSDLRLVAENAETQRLFRLLAAGGGPELAAARSATEEYLAMVWSGMSPYYRAAELRDLAGSVVLRLGPEATRGGPLAEWPSPGPYPEQPVLDQAIVDEASGAELGTVVAAPRLSELLPGEALETRFGGGGYSVVVDRRTGRVVHHSRGGRPAWGGPADAAALGFDATAPVLAARTGELRFRQDDTTRVAAFVSLAEPPWTVVSVAALEEFSAPFERMRALNLAVVLLVIVAVALASLFLVRRSTRSLEELTAAAGDVSRGEFLPALPPAGADEVGRLSAAFATMVARIREMMAQLQASRQMAAVGEFAAELAHEIRNPLTSVKLNLQRIERAVASEGGPREAAAPLRIALREVARLERVVRGVLSLGRPRPLERTVVSLHGVAREAVDVVRPEAEARAVSVVIELAAGDDLVLADPDQLRGALLNLLLNGIEAMPEGGRLTVATRDGAGRESGDGGGDDGGDGGVVELTVRDTGPGIPPESRDRLFRPFFTTKPEGTGLGLAVALRTVEEHGGRLELLAGADGGAGGGGGGGGAAFRLVLPRAAVPAHAGAGP